MKPLLKSDLMSLEDYSQQRPSFRSRVMAHKKNRQVAVGPNAMLYFEDRFTMQYQMQEILRIEKIFEASAIEEELEAYNPLIPDGNNWKATFMIEFAEESERRMALSRLIGIEKTIWVRVSGHEKVYPIANEDLERETEDKTSAVHFLRFQLDEAMRTSAKAGQPIDMGVEHDRYAYTTGPLPDNIRQSLADDLALPV